MEESSYILQQTKSDRDETIKATIKATFKELSLLADDLISQAKNKTKTREEYIAYLEGAAFIFYRVCSREVGSIGSASSSISTIQDAINHCNDLLPFMTEMEKEEHIRLMNWLNELLERRGEEKININIHQKF